MIKVSIKRFDKVLREEIPSDYQKAYVIKLIDEVNDTSSTRLFPESIGYDVEYERYSKIDKIRKMVANSDDEYIYVDYDMVVWMEQEGL